MKYLALVISVYADTTAHAHGAPNWDADRFGDNDGYIEIYRDNVSFRGVLREVIRNWNRNHYLYPDEPRMRQVRTLERADVRIHASPSPDFACGGGALVWIGAVDEVSIANGCFDHWPDRQPLRGTLLHETGHLYGIHHHEICTPQWQQLSVMVSGVNNSGCGVPLMDPGSHDIVTLAELG